MQRKPKIIGFVGDSTSDVNLRKKGAGKEVFTIGRAGSKKQGMSKKGKLVKRGATFVTKDLRSLVDLDFNKALGKASEGKRYRRTPLRFAKLGVRRFIRK